MRCLVTGAAGFIGSHLVENLIVSGHEVIGLDDMSTGRQDNLAAVSGHPRFGLVQGSILDATLVDELTAGSDCVFHLAAAVGAVVIREWPLESLRTNVHGTENVVEAASRHDARLLIASTGEIYGKNATVGLREDADRVIGSPLRSRWTYAEAKAIGESLVDGYVRERGLRAVTVRLFNTAGPRQSARYGMVIPRFVRQALTGRPLTVFGTGEQVRCFCHVLDVIPALIRLVQSDRASGLAVNLGSSQQVSIDRLARTVIAATGTSSVIERSSYLDVDGSAGGDMQRRVPDCTLARELVGFDAMTPLAEIIQSVITDQWGRIAAGAAMGARGSDLRRDGSARSDETRPLQAGTYSCKRMRSPSTGSARVEVWIPSACCLPMIT
jgi:UDP-glucose 4-epimerase